MSDRLERGSLYAPDAFRSGVTAEFDSNGVRPSLFLGFARIGDRTGPLAGAGVEVALSHASQIGLEAMHGYLGAGSIQLAATGSFRVIPNVSLHAGPGYLSTPAGSAWSISAGVSLTSLGIDFHPVYDEKKEEEFILPSYEEMEKTRKSVRPPGGDGQNQQEEKRNE
jgi:hypothetical protein